MTDGPPWLLAKEPTPGRATAKNCKYYTPVRKAGRSFGDPNRGLHHPHGFICRSFRGCKPCATRTDKRLQGDLLSARECTSPGSSSHESETSRAFRWSRRRDIARFASPRVSH